MPWPWSNKTQNTEELHLQEEETKVGLEAGKPTIFRRRTYRKEKKADVASSEPNQNVESKVFEKDYTIRPKQYEIDTLGRIDRGIRIIIEGKEKFGSNFSLFIMDSENVKSYKKAGLTKGAIFLNTDESEVNDSVTVRRADEYFLIITSRAVDKPRKVWVRLEIK